MLNNNKHTSQQILEWKCSWYPFLFITTVFYFYILINRDFKDVYHDNICSIIDCSLISIYPFKLFLGSLFFISIISLMLNVKVAISSLTLTLLCFYIFSYEESIGFKGEFGIITMILLTLSVAAIWYKPFQNDKFYSKSIQFPIQIISAAYVLSGISKLNFSGLSWFTSDAKYFSLKIIRAFHSNYSSTGNVDEYFAGIYNANWVLDNLFFMQIMLAISLFLELFCFVAILNKKIAFYYSFLLTGMHIGIYYFMDVFLPTITLSMVFFFLNPAYVGFSFVKIIKARF